MRKVRGTPLAAIALTLAALSALAACGGGDDNGSSSSGSSASGGKTIALLLPETKTTRYEQHDRPRFEAKVKELCPDCKVDYANATQDPSKQQTQAEAALTNGADVLVLDAVDVGSVAAIVQQAKQRNVPVIAYDRLIPDQKLDAYVSFNNVRQGELQAKSLLDALGGSADGKSIVMINGAPTDPSAGDYKKGAHNVFDASGVKIAKEYDTADWSPDKAQREMEQAMTALGKDGFAGVYSANDGMAGGAIAAMKGGGVDPKTRPVSGGDGEVAAIQRILDGEQASTIYLTIDKQADAAAQLAVAKALGKPVPAGLINGQVDNGAGQIPSVLLVPVVVTKDNIDDTVIKDGFLKPSDICTGKYASACKSAGIS
jgi:D-xylose transport system substrate-binding protein